MKIIYTILLLISSLSYSMGTLPSNVDKQNSSESFFQHMPNEIKRHILYQASSFEELGKFAQVNREFAEIIKNFTTQDFNNFLDGKITEQDKEILNSYLNNLVEENKELTHMLLVSFIGEKKQACQDAVDALVFKCKHLYATALELNHSIYFLDAIGHDYPQIINAIIKAGISVNSTDFLGDTPLMIAARWSKEKLVKQLLDTGADAHKKNIHGLTALDLAKNDNIRKLITNKIYEEDYQAETQPMDIEQ